MLDVTVKSDKSFTKNCHKLKKKISFGLSWYLRTRVTSYMYMICPTSTGIAK